MEDIRIIKTNEKDIAEYDKKTWYDASKELYGENVNWVEQSFAFKAVLDNQIVGTCVGKFEGGVIFISTLIVSDNLRGKGVGKKLLNHIIEWAKQFKPHLVFLYTRGDWDSYEFYKHLGFKEVGELKNLYLKKDFVIMAKDIDN